jgi:hypothetical protein
MSPGATYSVSLWITNGYSTTCKYVTNNIGLLFTKDSTWQSPPSVILSHTPQLNISSVVDSTGWKQYSFNYVADSAYKYITIGNFYNDNGTIIVSKITPINPMLITL